MIHLLISTSIICFIMLIYIYIGYPIVLWILSSINPAKRIGKSKENPKVTLIISCYNEEKIIEHKLTNTLGLSYPKDKLEVIVVSDGSTDSTDKIVSKYAGSIIKLLRIDGRLGKTACLNVAVKQASGEIIVFSDANAIYEKDSILRLVECFSDDTIGYVVGSARYSDGSFSSAAKSEQSYWQYEIAIKKMESRLSSIVGGDGAIYAIKKELYTELESTDINDFVNPLQIIEKGYRGIYEPKAICWEQTSGSFEKEFERKVRIVNRSLNGLIRVKSVLNPFKYGYFSFQLFSHKFLRWFSPYFLLGLILSVFILSYKNISPYDSLSYAIIVFIILADIGWLLSKHLKMWFVFYGPYYFFSMNIASFIGTYKRLRGKTQVIWNPVRTEIEKKNRNHLIYFSIVQCLITLSVFLILPLRLIFWFSFATIVYVYFGYPLFLLVASKLFSKKISISNIEPSVCMLVCAYNEEEVIEEKILNSMALEYPIERLKIFFASDGSTDATCSIIEKYRNDNIILMDYKERSGKIGAILKTIPIIKSDIIVFSDANTMYKKDAIKKLVRNFNDPNVGAVSADVILLNEETQFGQSESLYYRYERWIQHTESDLGSIIGADGGMYAIRSNLFVEPSPDIILDDFVISMNIAINGKRLVYENEAIGYERSTISNKTEFLRKSRVIAGAIQALKRGEGIPGSNDLWLLFTFTSHKLLRWFVPLLLLSLYFSNLLIVINNISSNYIITLAGQIGFYCFAITGAFSIGLAKKWIFSVPFYFCMVNLAALYGLYKGLLNKQPVAWAKFARK
jgi:cellulose synthase/poly-beta-1,6-N-acetylglucosamine synthase-like glycosyltransferase